MCHNLVFLHVNYNTFRVVFWCLYKLMADGAALAAVRREVADAVAAKACEGEAEFTPEDVNNLPVIGEWCSLKNYDFPFLKEYLFLSNSRFERIRSC